MRPPLIGFLLGLFCTMLWFVMFLLRLKLEWDSWIAEFLVWISTPVAHIVGAITGWKLEQENTIFIYSFLAIPITLPLLGLLMGWAFSLTKKLLHKSRP